MSSHLTSENLVRFLAQICTYAQEHVDDADAWPIDSESRSNFFQCTSYQVACFIAQNTEEGVDANVVLDDLIQHPAKTESEWVNILRGIVSLYIFDESPTP
jgi:hypothetical protein